MTIILGAGLAGLSCSFHLGHDNCTLYEKMGYPTGHIHTEYINGFTWDEGPHVSFTENDYVKNFLAESLSGEFLEYPVKTTNYYQGSWIPHPAQSNLYAIPQPLRDQCLDDFMKARLLYPDTFEPVNYQDWLDFSFGIKFSNTFPAAYTRKYWTVEASQLTTDWVGSRVFIPKVEQVREGYKSQLNEETHYIKKVRYPKKGGYMMYAGKLLENAKIEFLHDLSFIDFKRKKIDFLNGSTVFYEKLISTIPLPFLIDKSDAPQLVKQAAQRLNCSSVLLVNVMANHSTARPDNWIYVYDEDKFSTRINCTELLSPLNAPLGKTGIQVEVYFSPYRPKVETDEEIARKVIAELIEMKLLHSLAEVDSYHTKWVQWANVIFDKERKKNQEIVLNWLSENGLIREDDDLLPMTNWDEKFNENIKFGDLVLAGRFGQWKYFWSDDCILRGKIINDKI